MKRCEWCGKQSQEVFKVQSLGTEYSVCKSCRTAHQDETCIICGESTSAGSIKGRCYGCSQADYEERQRKAEEVANGVDMDLFEFYSNGVEFTEQDYNEWVTFSQGDITPEKRKRTRRNWIRKKLLDEGKWTTQMVEENLDDLEYLLERYMAKIINDRYAIAYYDGKNKAQKRIRQFIDHRGNVFIVEKK